MSVKNTEEMENQIKKTNSIKDYINENKNNMVSSTLSELLNQLIESKKIKRADVANDSNMHRTYVYEIFNGSKNPSRDKVIELAFGMKLNLEETQNLLKSGGYRELYSRDSRDSVIIYAIHKGKPLMDCNFLLDSLSEEPLE